MGGTSQCGSSGLSGSCPQHTPESKLNTFKNEGEIQGGSPNSSLAVRCRGGGGGRQLGGNRQQLGNRWGG